MSRQISPRHTAGYSGFLLRGYLRLRISEAANAAMISNDQQWSAREKEIERIHKNKLRIYIILHNYIQSYSHKKALANAMIMSAISITNWSFPVAESVSQAVATALEIATVANVRMNEASRCFGIVWLCHTMSYPLFFVCPALLPAGIQAISSACHEVEPWAKLKKNTSDEKKSLALRELLVMAEGALRGNSGVSFWWPGDWDDLEGNGTYSNIFEHIRTPWIWPSRFQRFWCRCSHLRCASFSCHTGTKRKDSGRVRSWPRRVMASHTWHGVTGLTFASACCIGI